MQPDFGVTDNPPARIRFGLMCRSLTFPNWQAQCLRLLLANPNVEPALVILDSRSPEPPSSLWKKLATLARLRINLFSLYNRYIVARCARATQPVDLSSLFKDVPRIQCVVTRKGKFSEYFAPDDLVRIRQANLDFMLRFGFNIIRGEILEAARYGVWSFHHGDEQKYRGAPPCFWEIYNGEPETGAILQRLTERLDGGIVLKKGWFPTVHHSYPGNRDAAHFLGAPWPAEVCADLLAGRAAYLDQPPSITRAPIYLAPRNGKMLAFTGKQAIRALGRVLRLATIGIATRPADPEQKGNV